MKHIIEVVKVMTPFPHTLESSSTLMEAQRVLEDYTTDFFPVTAAGELKGVITTRGIQVALSSCPEEERKRLRLKDLALARPYTVETTEHLSTVLSYMKREGLEVAVVVKNDRVVGTFSYVEAYTLLLKFIAGLFTLSDPPDLTA